MAAKVEYLHPVCSVRMTSKIPLSNDDQAGGKPKTTKPIAGILLPVFWVLRFVHRIDTVRELQPFMIICSKASLDWQEGPMVHTIFVLFEEKVKILSPKRKSGCQPSTEAANISFGFPEHPLQCMPAGVQGLVDGLQVSLPVFGAVFYHVIHPHLDEILDEHPYDVVDLDKADQPPWECRNQPPKSTHEHRKELSAHDGTKQCQGRKRRHEKRFLCTC